ncbi:MAG: AAA family ATPase, partial [Chloroflexota bacterium]|nr:AAA family ATPase [Chloroflexota bacterium]
MALIELSVENLAVVEAVRLPLARGFTVLTGETGAGKSLVVDAVALVLGARASADQVRAGTDGARIEAIFDDVPRDPNDPLDELIDEGTLIVRREVSSDGRSLARANDRAVTVGSLAALGARLGEIHGQNEQQRLLLPERQLALLDRFAALDVASVAELHRAWRTSVVAAGELLTDAHELARRVELLRHQSDEIASAALAPGEDLEVEARLRAAQHAEAIALSAAQAATALRDEGGATDALHAGVAALESAASHDDRFAELA